MVGIIDYQKIVPATSGSRWKLRNEIKSNFNDIFLILVFLVDFGFFLFGAAGSRIFLGGTFEVP